MLILTRKLGEAIRVGSDVEVFVVGVSRGKVKLGFRAPRETPIQRAEVASRIADGGAPNAPVAAVLPLPVREVRTAGAPLRHFRQVGVM